MSYAIFARIILSWIRVSSPTQSGKIRSFIYDITEPILKIARKLPHRIGILDLSPFTAMIIINFLVYGLVKLIILI